MVRLDEESTSSDNISIEKNGNIADSHVVNLTNSIVECCHRAKRKLVNNKEVRKKLKGNVRSCEECTRLEKDKAVKEVSSEVLLLCLTCGKGLCRVHSKEHSLAVRSSDPHPFFFDTHIFQVRCELCNVIIPTEDVPVTDPIRMIVNDFRSLQVKDATKNGKSATRTNGEETKVNQITEKKEKEKVSQSESEVNGKKLESDRETPSNNERNGKNCSTKMPSQVALPAKGLANLGNTCFFNSVMQCILHTHQLQFYFERFGRVRQIIIRPSTTIVNDEKVELEETTLTVTPSPSPINDALRSFINDFRSGRTPSPNNLFNQIAQKATRFRSMAQQDAHELLRYLLDGLCSEETQRYQLAIANHLQYPLNSQAKIDPAIMRKAKGYLQQSGRPLIDVVFGGRLLQTIRCSACHHVSEKYEHFYDLSVPLGNQNGRSVEERRGSNANGNRMSKHQKKKEAVAAKRASRKNSHPNSIRKDDSNSEDLAAKMEELNVDREEAEEAEEEEEEDDEKEEKTVDRLDYTKVLAPFEGGVGQTVAHALLEFTAEERLEGSNKYECEECCTPVNKKNGSTGSSKKRVEATKRYLIVTPPVVLTIHLKRFQQVHAGARVYTKKMGGHVPFSPIFDIAPFCCKTVERITPGQKSIRYSLYGVVSHSGDLGGGHYIAYVKSRDKLKHIEEMLERARKDCVDIHAEGPIGTEKSDEENGEERKGGQWYYCSDSRVSIANESKILSAEAYILFYERIY